MNGAHAGVRTAARAALALFYGAAGLFHLALPAPFIAITPLWAMWPQEVVMLTGIAELFGAMGLIQPFDPRLRRAAAIGLALYAVCVFPANINHMLIDMARAEPNPGLAYHIPRMAFQPFIIWLALWAGEVIDWPYRSATKPR